MLLSFIVVAVEYEDQELSDTCFPHVGKSNLQ